MPDAEVLVAGVTRRTGVDGRVVFTVTAGVVDLTVVKPGFTSVTQPVRVDPGAVVDVRIELQAAFEEVVTVVSSTRTGRRLEDQPTRVEVLEREEIEEKMLMTPGDIVMMLNEMGGMRVQSTSPSLGAASVRIQGMRGRYTRVLSDGLPIFGDVGGLGLLQIPPMDLGQVEVIKGVASALYGSGAMGGVINLLSRRPAENPVHEFLFNRSTRGATDAVAFLSGRARRGWSASLLAGGHFQEPTDIDDDGWADLAEYERAVARPRFLWEGAEGARLLTTIGATAESRDGGTIDGRVLMSTGEPYVEALGTRRYDGGVVGEFPYRESFLISTRASIVQQRHEHRFGEVLERDRHNTAFAEVALRRNGRRHTWVTGVAFERDSYAPRDVPRFEYAFNVPGVFGQLDADLSRNLLLSASARLDFHNEYGTFLSPRVSALARGGGWTSRFSIGTGFSAATPLTEETEAAGLTRLIIEQPLEAERGLSASFDLSRTEGPFSGTITLFGSRVRHALAVERSTSFRLGNHAEPVTSRGLEVLGVLRRAPFSVTATYAYVRSRETADGVRQDVALTPRHGAGVVGIWEAEEVGRVGVEWYYTGTQRLDANPYRAVSEPYMILGILAERQLGRFRLFINGENLTGVRQTTWNPMLRPSRAVDGRWTVDAWAPLEGRTVNGGLRIRL